MVSESQRRARARKAEDKEARKRGINSFCWRVDLKCITPYSVQLHRVGCLDQLPQHGGLGLRKGVLDDDTSVRCGRRTGLHGRGWKLHMSESKEAFDCESGSGETWQQLSSGEGNGVTHHTTVFDWVIVLIAAMRW